jgi:hypothetical protein
MAQPCGRVCGISSRYSTYVRSSPFFCAADSLSIIVRLLVTSLTLGISPRTALSLLMQRRFDDVRPMDDLTAAKYATWLRWLYFVLGPLPMGIKLASFQGTPWTQGFGFIFVGSFALVELLTLLDKIISQETTLNRTVHRQYQSLNAKISIAEERFAWVALVTQYCTLYYLTFCALMEISNGALLAVAILHMPMLVFSCAFSFSRRQIKRLYRKYPRIAQNLQLWDPEKDANLALHVDDMAAQMLLLFFVNLISCILLYCYLFDPNETVNPDWTIVFGK